MKENVRKMEEALATMSAIGADEAGGLTRLLYDDAWKKAQETLRGIFERIGLQSAYDQVGNLIGQARGAKYADEIVLTGSHVDTVRNGGALDGQYGILAGYLAVERLLRKYGQPARTLSVVSFAEEEGSRFPYVFWGSKNLIGIADREDARSLSDARGVSFPEAMAAAGFDFEAAASAPIKNVVAFVEAHIEQGGVLEQARKQVGVVTAIAGQKRFTVTLTGEANHAGTTPMSMRRDAMEGAARCQVALLDEAKRRGAPLVLTFGRVLPKPNIVNVVPGEVVFTVDTRHTDPAALDAFGRTVESVIRETAGALGLEAQVELWMDEPPVPMDQKLVADLSDICRNMRLEFQVMHSGAGHDSQIIAPVFPTVMLFVPSIRGVSHNPAENTRLEDLVAGVDVLEAFLHQLAY
jgi:allantoate deiminase